MSKEWIEFARTEFYRGFWSGVAIGTIFGAVVFAILN